MRKIRVLSNYGKACTPGGVKQAFDHRAGKIHDRWEEIQRRAIASERSGGLVVETTTASGTVTAVDMKERIVTIEGAGGGVLELAAIQDESPPSAASRFAKRIMAKPNYQALLNLTE